MRKRGGRNAERVGTRAPILVEAKAERSAGRWTSSHDQFACGRRFRMLNIVDDVTRECLAAIADTSISGRRVARELTDADRPPRQAGHDRLRSRHRVHLERHPRLVEGSSASNGTTSRRASRCRTASSRASCMDGPCGARSLMRRQRRSGAFMYAACSVRPMFMTAGPDGVRGSTPHQRVALARA